MRLHFHGACRAVTGSCFLLETGSAKVLIDCGMVQGSKTEKELNYRPFPFRPSDIDAVVLSHSHIDHSGLSPGFPISRGLPSGRLVSFAAIDGTTPRSATRPCPRSGLRLSLGQFPLR